MTFSFFLIGLVFFLIYCTVHTILIILLFREKKEPLNLPENLPFISVLLAVRNEEENITECLKALSKTDWPANKIEFLVGNDQSEDRTAELVRTFQKKDPRFRLFEIRENLGLARGKANVLAHLTHEAKGSFFCITDADIRVPETWIKGLVGTWEKGTGTVNGVTMVKGESWFSRFQCIDWINAFGMVRVVTKHGIPVSAVGNNMLISRESYFSTGGYEHITFSVTEDLRLFQETIKKGWNYKNLLQPEVLAFTEPVKSLAGFLNQRKRWTTGAVQLPRILLFVLSLQSLSLPFLLMVILYPLEGLFLWLLQTTLRYIFTSLCLRKVGKPEYRKFIPLFIILQPLLGFLQILNFNFYQPGQLDWKGRTYSYQRTVERKQKVSS